MSGWSGRTRRVTLPADWEARRLAVLERERWQCQHKRADTGRPCGAYATECDHIDGRTDHRLENLQALCPWHHLRKSGQQGGLALQAARRARQQAAAPEHPGVLDAPIRPTRNDPPRSEENIMADTTETLFTVARDKEILTGLRSQVRAAKSDLAGIENAMRAAGLEPDVHLATVTRTTRVSAPKVYIETPAAVDEPAEQGDEADGKAVS